MLMVRVPRSFNPPHRIIRQGSNRFWAAAGKYEPDVNELRVLFNAGPQLADRIRNFRDYGDSAQKSMTSGSVNFVHCHHPSSPIIDQPPPRSNMTPILL